MAHEVWLPVHVIGFLVFLATHVVVIALMASVRRSRDVERTRRLLRVSLVWTIVSTLALLLVIIAGIVMTTVHDWWSLGWIWASVGLVLAIWAYMAAVAARPYHDLRRAYRSGSVTPQVLEEAAAKMRPWLTAAVAVVWLVAILWLMVRKPF
jgi:hypothetical protein